MFNPINIEIFNNLFSSICEEMGAVLRRSSFSTNIKERKDFSCALFDKQGDMVAQAEHLPVHLASMSLSVKEAITNIKMSDGDTVILNDPFKGGTHLPDVTMVTPFFMKNKKKPIFFVANRAHHADFGGLSPGSICNASEIYQEGLRIPPVTIVRKGEIDNDILSIILANVRNSEERRWDLIAQLSANKIGKQRLNELVDKYGISCIFKYSNELQKYSDRIMRSVINEIPDGEYSFYDFLDNDGITEIPVEIKVQITIRGDRAVVDFSGSSDQVKGCINAVYAVTVSALFYAFRCLVDHDIPSNSGCLNCIDIIAPLGTVINASEPCAVSARNVETSQRIVDVIFGALSKAVPDKIAAASCGTMNNIAIGGYDKKRKRYYTYYETIAGGMGARPNCDGIAAIQTNMTNTMNTPIEAIEHNFPFRIKKYNVRLSSGGKGFHKGGDGIIRDYEFLDDAIVTILSDRRIFAPYGIKNGENGKVGRNFLISGKKSWILPSKKTVDIKKGEIISIYTPGGGGYGKIR